MNRYLRPYPDYKDSGLPWLERVPKHWRQTTLRRVADIQLSNVDKHTIEGEQPVSLCNYTDVYYHRYIMPSMDLMKATALPREIEKFALSGADVLITKDSEDWKDIAVPALVTRDMDTVLCGYHLALIRPEPAELHGEYLMWAFRSEPIALQFRVAAKGVTRYAVSGPGIKSGVLPLPPIDEQEAIGRFLRTLDKKVRRFIRNRRRLIEVLNEQKQAIINRAVTRGLDLDAPLKPSGIDWLGDIPEHWAATTLGRLVSAVKTGPFGSILHQSDYIPDGIPLINPVHMSGGRIRADRECAVDDATFNRLREYALVEGDIVFSRRGELGRCALVRAAETGWLIGTGSIRARLLPGAIAPSYLIVALQGRWVSDYLSLMSVGATMQSLNTSILSRVPLPLPPIAEQKQIRLFIEDESARVVEAVDRAQREIHLICEYRTRMIADVVTGKVDVRHLAPPPGSEDLEEAVDELEPLEDAAGELDEEALAGEVADADD